MDVVLEAADWAFFDRFYSTVAPLTSSSYNATFGDIASFQKPYVPASKYMPLGTTDFTYTSAVDRDNIYRQFISLYLITWYVSTTLAEIQC